MKVGWHLVLFILVANLSQGFLRAEDRLWVDCKVNGQPVRLAFDTGASHLVLFTKTAQRLGLSVVYPTNATPAPKGLVTGGKSEECEFDLAGNIFKTQFRIYDIPGFMRTKADGVLGWGSLRKEIFWIDADADSLGTLREVPEKARTWQRFDLQADADTLTLSVPEKTHTNTVVIDTGSSQGIELAPGQWRDWKSKQPGLRFTLNATFLPAVGLFVSEEAWADKIRIGPLILTDVPVTEARPEGTSFPSAEAAFGMAVLRRIQLIVDGRHGVAYMNVRKEAPSTYEHNRLGAVFIPNDPHNDSDLIAHVAGGSPADRAGVQNGDVLLTINDLNATKWRTDPAVLPLSRFWNQPEGTRIHLALRRKNQTNEVNVKLESILGPQQKKSDRNLGTDVLIKPDSASEK